ncbi:reverse transcriptase domain-containing protein [Tanacetum coccineum]
MRSCRIEEELTWVKTFGKEVEELPQSEVKPHMDGLSKEEKSISDKVEIYYKGIYHYGGQPNFIHAPQHKGLASMIAWIELRKMALTWSAYVTANGTNGNGNGANGGNGGNGNNGCTYKSFMSCNPKEYDGKGGAVVLTRWIERMETVIDNSGCAENQKVRYVASSLVNKALTWWNTQVQARGREAANAMSWNDFKALLVEEFCPSNEMERLENEFWNHKMIGANHAGYTDRFHELAKLVPHLVTPESARIKRYMAGLAPEIRGMLKAMETDV